MKDETGMAQSAPQREAARLGVSLDAEIRAFIELSNQDYPDALADLPIAEQRALYDAMCARFRAPRPDDLGVIDMTIPGPAGPLPIRRYAPKKTATSEIVYFHGGGFVFGSLESHDDVCAELAEATGMALTAVDYRLSPEHPHPAAFEDAFRAALHLGRDGKPLILAGDSVGGNLAAGVAVALRGATHPNLAGVVLIYPSLSGGAQTLPSMREHADAPLLSAADNARIAAIHAGPADRSELAAGDPRFAPLAARQVDGVAPCIALATEVDPLRDDGLAWVEMLSAAGVSAAASVHAGLPHGALRARHKSLKAKMFFDAAIAALLQFRKI